MRTKDITCLLAAVLCTASSGHLQDSDDEAHDSDWIVFTPREGLVVDKRFESTNAKTVESITYRRGDEERVERSDSRFAASMTIVLRDTYRSDYREPRFVLERSFEELSEHAVLEGEEGSESTSPFEGRTVLLVWDRENDEITATFVDEGEIDDEDTRRLRGLIPLTDLTCFLPQEEVAVGAEWEVSFDLFKWDVLRPCGYLSWQSDPPNPAADWLKQQTWNELNGDIEAEYARRIETDEGPVAAIGFRGHLEASVDLDVPDDGRLPRSLEIDEEIEGELRWDLEHGLPMGLTMKARGTFVETYEAVREPPEENLTVEFRYAMTSERTFTFE